MAYDATQELGVGQKALPVKPLFCVVSQKKKMSKNDYHIVKQDRKISLHV
jgi:hypothetical protein